MLWAHIFRRFSYSQDREREELLQGGLPGTNGDVSVSGWSNTEIFKRYMHEHFMKYIYIYLIVMLKIQYW
jgi:hypothetical protein